MKMILRWGGIAMIAAGAVLAAVFFFSGPPAPEGELALRMDVKEKVISGAYKTYGVKGAPLPMWAAKTVFRNTMNGRVTNLKVRYRATEYSVWYHSRQPAQNSLILQLILSKPQTATHRICVTLMYSTRPLGSIGHNSNMRISPDGSAFGPHFPYYSPPGGLTPTPGNGPTGPIQARYSCRYPAHRPG